MKKTKTKRRCEHENSESGFTFVETLAALAVGAILTAGVGVSASKAIDWARSVSTRQTVAQYKAALESYYADCGMFPTAQQGLDALWQKPALVPVPSGWNGPYVDRQIQRDAWGADFAYYERGSSAYPGIVPGGIPFAIISYGADGIEGGSGKNEDICSWQ